MNQKDMKRFKKMLEESKKNLLNSAKKTLMEESNFDTDDLPDAPSSCATMSVIMPLSHASVWWRWTAPADGIIDLAATGAPRACVSCRKFGHSSLSATSTRSGRQ